MLSNSDACATIGVRDLPAAQKFYGDVLGLEKSTESPGGVFYKSGNSSVFIYPTSVAGTNKATYASWMVDDVDGVAAYLKSKGVRFEQYDDLPGMTRDGDMHVMGDLRAAWFKDPDGNILNIVNKMG